MTAVICLTVISAIDFSEDDTDFSENGRPEHVRRLLLPCPRRSFSIQIVSLTVVFVTIWRGSDRRRDSKFFRINDRHNLNLELVILKWLYKLDNFTENLTNEVLVWDFGTRFGFRGRRPFTQWSPIVSQLSFQQTTEQFHTTDYFDIRTIRVSETQDESFHISLR
jgi:hypothetical protein